MPPSGLLGIVVATALGGGARAAGDLAGGAARRPAPAGARCGSASRCCWRCWPSPALVAGRGRRRARATLSALRFALLLAREIVVGLCLGLVASAAFRAAEIAGPPRRHAARRQRRRDPGPDRRRAREPARRRSTCCWRRSSSCRSAACRAWSRRCCRSYQTLPIGGRPRRAGRAPRGAGRRGRVGEADRVRAWRWRRRSSSRCG